MIVLKTPQEIEILKECNQLVARALNALRTTIAPGITTEELDRMTEELIREKGALPAFKGYRQFPCSVCISVNEEIVHGIPDSRKLKEGDIVSLDVGVKWRGFYGDSAITVPVGEVDDKAKKLIEVTERALYRGIEKAVVGNRLYDISHAIQRTAESHGFSVVRDFVGHGIGKDLHEDPQVPNFGQPHQGPRLQEGMVLALEPMVNEGTYDVKILSDGWTAVTVDGKRSAHFEHSIAISQNGPIILSEQT
jgi:methionyl aminopeptidase